MDQPTRRSHGHDQTSALASDTFDKLCNASTLKDILALYRQLCSVCKLVPTNFQNFFPKIRGKIPSWRAEELWSRFEKKAAEKCYARGRYCANTKVLIIGSGPCGLRAAIEAQLLGAKVVVIEKRQDFSRNNVLHFWPFLITDLRTLGAKVLYGKFCAGSIDHISIRQLQCILLKVALLLGVEFYEGVGFQGLKEPTSSACDDGWRAQITPSTHPVSQYQFDVVLGADGRRSILSSEGFKRKALRAKLAIAITANFINKHTEAEAKVEEISGVSYIFRQQFFQDMDEAMGIALENIVYYKDETHYFVMTPKKQSLLEKGVLYQDFPEPEMLLSPENVDQEALQRFTMEAVVFATDNRLPELEFALNHYGQPDVAVFDFTTMYTSENACRAVQRKGHKLLIGLIGDALFEPFWPTGSGCARGFLSSFDACWMIRQWGKGLNSVLEVLAERESIYRLLGQTTHENLNKDHSQYTIDPRTRYPKINLNAVNARQITYLYDSDTPIQDIYDPIRDPSSKVKEFVMPEDFLVRWLQQQLSSKEIPVDQLASVCEVFNGGSALPALIHRYRPDLIEFPMPDTFDKCVRNQIVFEVLGEEYDLHFPLEPEKSVKFGDGERSILIRYLSQIYLRFKGDIPRDNLYDSIDLSGINNKTSRNPQYPNNSKLHHSLSIKEFLRAKELLEKNRKEQEDNNQSSRREKRRSQFYDALINGQNGDGSGGVGGGSGSGGGGLQRSQTSVNVVIPIVKLNPVPPGELFAACRQGRGKDVASENRPASVASSNPNSKITRSRSDVGFRRGPSPLAATAPTGSVFRKGSCNSHSRNGSNHNDHNANSAQQQDEQVPPALEMQMKIMKRRATPAGAIISTFLQKQAIQNQQEQENAEANWTKRQIRDLRARSLNNSTFNGWGKKPENEVASNNNNHHHSNHTNVVVVQKQSQPLGPEVSFKDKCKFLERNIYNSGRDVKVHCSSVPWFSDTSSTATVTARSNNETNNLNRTNRVSPAPNRVSPPTTPSSPFRGAMIPLQKSSTAASTCFLASKKQQEAEKKQNPIQFPFVKKTNNNNNNNQNNDQQQHSDPFQAQRQKILENAKLMKAHQQQQQQQQKQQQQQAMEQKLGSTIAGIKAQLVNPPQYHINGQIIHLGNNAKTAFPDNNNNSHRPGKSRTPSGGGTESPRLSPHSPQPTQQLLRKSATSIGVHSPFGQKSPNERVLMATPPFVNPRNVTDSSGESDSDLEFLKAIDFENIDGQELQELLSSF